MLKIIIIYAVAFALVAWQVADGAAFDGRTILAMLLASHNILGLGEIIEQQGSTNEHLGAR